MNSGNLALLQNEFIEKVGQIAQRDGLPPTAGRLFGLLVFSGDAISFSDLAEMLNVSRGNISSSSRLLEDRGLIRRITKPGDRQDYFQLEDNPYKDMMQGIAQDVSRAGDEIAAMLEKLPEDADGPKQRLGDYLQFYLALGEAVKDTARKL